LIKEITVEASPRAERGKNEARRLRRQGQIPAVLYGGGKESLPVSLNTRQISQILHSPTGHNTIFQVAVGEGTREAAMLIDWQIDPVKGSLLHTDLHRVDLSKTLHVKVPILIHGEAIGVKTQGGLLEVVTREVDVECLPADIPEHVVVEVSELELHQGVRVRDLKAGDKYRFTGDADQILVHVILMKKEEVKAAEVAVEGEAVAAAAPTEPEVIKKGKQLEEGAPEAKEPKEGKEGKEGKEKRK